MKINTFYHFGIATYATQMKKRMGTGAPHSWPKHYSHHLGVGAGASVGAIKCTGDFYFLKQPIGTEHHLFL